MEAEENKLSVWVCREEKLVSGLSKRTTCADVIKVLLEEQKVQNGAPSSSAAAMLSGSPQSYCLVEKWRGFERILPNKTKILRLWSAWGDEQENVRFVLLKSDASLPNTGPRSAEARVVLSKQSPCVYKGTAKITMALSQEKQRRIVRKAFRKLEKINKKRAQALAKDASSSSFSSTTTSTSVERMETLVHLVLSQDHTIRQQVQRIKELDREIERYEANVHLNRMKMHGINYVQETYLVDTGPDDDDDKSSASELVAQFEDYAQKCEEVIKLQEELTEREALLDSITTQIQEELNKRWMKRRKEELANKDSDPSLRKDVASLTAHEAGDSSMEFLKDNELLLEEDRIKTQLDTSLYIGLRLNTDLEAVRNDLDLAQEIWGAKERELRDLLEKVDSLDLEEEEEEEEKEEISAELKDSDGLGTEPASAPSLNRHSVWVEQARGLSKTCNTNDDDSDTGLSSMHSQDSDVAPVCESLV